MDLLRRIDERRRGGQPSEESRYSIDTYISEYLGSFSYGGQTYGYGNLPGLRQTLAGNRAAEIAGSLRGYTSALLRSPPAFAAQMVRALVLSQARFTFRNRPTSPTPRRTFGTQALGILERPWPRATTGELLARMEWHAGLAGNAYVARQGTRQKPRLRVLRPDWVAVVWGSESEPESEFAGHMLDGELLGFVYWAGGPSRGTPQILLPDECCHWSPIPDPLSPGMGMSWLTPALRDMQSDQVMTQHKIRYFEQGASPNLVIKGLTAQTQEQFNALVDMLEDRHTGAANAYRTLYLTGGADATVVGNNLAEIDFKSVQGASETRISFLSRVPAPILGIAEGLAGSSLNAGNFGQSRRLFADTWVYPTLMDLCAALANVVDVPSDAELWFDVADIPLLREDEKDAAEIARIEVASIRQLVDSGFVPDTAIAAVTRRDMTLLRHSGLVSVQLLPPGKTADSVTSPDESVVG